MAKQDLVFDVRDNEQMAMALKRQTQYVVAQANDLAKAFGNLSAFEHKLLDYATSFITLESDGEDEFVTNIADILRVLGINSSGENYRRVLKGLMDLQDKTTLHLSVKREDGMQGILNVNLFEYTTMYQDGDLRFKFSKAVRPYLFELKKNYFQMTLTELADIKGKYALILLKLWNAKMMKVNSQMVSIDGTLDEWQEWLLGDSKKMPAGRFKDKILRRAMDEIQTKKRIRIAMRTRMNGRNTVGYELTFYKEENNMALPF